MNNSNTMKAAIYRQYGGPEQLSIEQQVRPTPGPNELLVRIHASTVNRTDCGFLRGEPFIVRFFSGLRTPHSPVLGCEFAGEVIECGQDVSEYQVGDRVVGFKDDDFGFGGHAQFTCIPASAMVSRIPEPFSYEQAAPALEGAHYALHYIRAANVQAGHSVLVNGATGAIGSAAVQIVKHMGARVVAVCETKHMQTVQSLGADEVIDYTQQNFETLDKRFDFVFDAVGKSTFFKCRRLLHKHGCYASSELGPWSQNPFLALWSRWFGKRKVLFPIPVNTKQDAEYLCNLMERGHYTPLLDRSYRLDDLAEAYRYVETGMKTGNVVVNID
ncbi:MAG: NAD(P)-dependent alcohol dehydrogenase [Granulosicoccaceae bacterium]